MDWIGAVVPESSCGSRSYPARSMPSLEGVGGMAQRLEALAGTQRDRVGFEMFAPQEQSGLAGQGPGAVPQSAGIDWFASVESVVEYGARHLRVMRPGAAVEVVGAHGEPDVVDDADLRVHIYRPPVRTLEVVRGDTVASGRPQRLQAAVLTDPTGRTDERTVGVGETRDHDHDLQLGVLVQRLGERRRRIARPEVLVLDVDRPTGASERLEIGPGDASFAVRRERVARDGAPGMFATAAPREGRPAEAAAEETAEAWAGPARWPVSPGGGPADHAPAGSGPTSVRRTWRRSRRRRVLEPRVGGHAMLGADRTLGRSDSLADHRDGGGRHCDRGTSRCRRRTLCRATGSGDGRSRTASGSGFRPAGTAHRAGSHRRRRSPPWRTQSSPPR